MWSWLDAIICDHEAEEVNFSEAKLEFLWVEAAAISGEPSEEVSGSEEVVFYVVIINDGFFTIIKKIVSLFIQNN